MTIVAIVSAGCRPMESPAVPTDSGTASASTDTEDEQGEKSPRSDNQTSSDSEDWMAYFKGNTQIGYSHLVVEPAEKDGVSCRRYRYKDELKMKRFRDTTVIQTKLETLETADGQLIQFRSQVSTGPGLMVTEGVVDGDQLRLTEHSEGRTDKRSMAWDPNWGGFFADQHSLQEKPLQPGETRQLKALLPVLHQVGTVSLKAGSYEATRLLDGSKRLLRIDVTTALGLAQLKTVLWMDEKGVAWKTRDLQLGLEAYRTTREQATKATTGEGFDLGADTIVKLERPLDRPRETRKVVYRATLSDGDVEKLFVHDPSQQLRSLDDETVELTVIAIRPDDPKTIEQVAEPTAADRKSSSLVQSDHPLIIKLATEAAGDTKDPWQLACKLEQFVKKSVSIKNYSTAMATAAEVARTGEGDCTEHAMLLAALCRAREIPARVAIGLVYYPPARGFAYHMWTEVWIRDRWIGLDATLGDGGIGADHLKLATSDLSGSSAYADMLPVVQAIGRLQLEVVAAE